MWQRDVLVHESNVLIPILDSCVNYVAEPEDALLLKTALAMFRRFECQPEALKLAIQLNDLELVKEIFLTCTGR